MGIRLPRGNDERPRERLMQQGAAALSPAELLAILIGSGNSEETAVQLMQRVLSDCGEMYSFSAALVKLPLAAVSTYNELSRFSRPAGLLNCHRPILMFMDLGLLFSSG